jgi:hypothetical protein
MNRILALSILPMLAVPLLGASEAQAKGCIKGAIVGGIAGHFAGHHGLAGAAAGCVIGRHNANAKAQQQRDIQEQAQPAPGTQRM